MKKLVAIALLAGMSSSLVVAQSAVRVLDAQTQAQLIEAFGTQLKEHYVDAELAQQVSTDLQVRFAKGEYQNISDPEQFATLLTEQSRRISKDKHMVLRYVDEPVPHDGLPPSPAQRAKWTKALENVNFGVERVERLPGNIGYLDLRMMVDLGLAAPALSAAMSLLQNSRALVIDLRNNQGGSPATVAYLAGYFFEDRIHWSDIYRRDDNNHIERFWTSPIDRDARYGSHKKVYVLTSSRTFSAAEDLSYGLKQFKRATLVGETTAGGAHPVLPRRLHEHFVAIIPNARSVHPLTKTNWEGVGVEPDVRTSEKLAPMRAQVLALQSLLPIESDEVERARMRERIGELERDIAAGFGLCPRE